MSQFVDVYMPEAIKGMPCQVQPRFSTRIVLAKSGDEARNQNWQSPLRKFMLPEAVSDPESLEAALDFWLCTGGPLSTWPFRDPFDFSSAPLSQPNVAPPTSGDDQQFGVGDGFTRTFQLTKMRTVGPLSYTRTIVLPIIDTVEILMDGYLPADVPNTFLDPLGGPYVVTDISRPGGEVTFDHAPVDGLVLTWGGLFDTEVRWEADDTLDAVVHSLETAGASPFNLVEVRRC